MTDSILRTAAVALLAVSSLFSVACSSVVAEPARSEQAAVDMEKVDVASACAGDDFGTCAHAADVARRQGDALSAFEALRARCQAPTGDERTAANACFAAIGIAVRDLGDEALAASVAKYRCDRFGTNGAGKRIYACPVEMPARDVDGAAASLGSVRLPTAPRSPRAVRIEMEAIERKKMLEALDQCGGNQTKAAELLGISRRTLVSRMSEYDLPRPRKRA